MIFAGKSLKSVRLPKIYTPKIMKIWEIWISNIWKIWIDKPASQVNKLSKLTKKH